MEREENETLPSEVEEMSGRGEFSEGKRRGNCPLLRRKMHPASLWKIYLGSEHVGLVPAWVCHGVETWWLQHPTAEFLMLICRPTTNTKDT